MATTAVPHLRESIFAMDTFKSLVQPIIGGSSMVDGMKLVLLGGTVETARRLSSSAWSHFVNSFFLTAHFLEEDSPFDWLMLWLSRQPEWQRCREFETSTRKPNVLGKGNRVANGRFIDISFGEEVDDGDENSSDALGKPKTRVVFNPTFNTTHTIFYRGHWLRVRRTRRDGRDGFGSGQVLSVSVVARSNAVLKQLVLQAKREYEAETVHRIMIYFATPDTCWRFTDSRHKRPMSSIVLNPGVKEMLLNDSKDFLKSEKWYADRGIPFRRGYLLHGVPGSGKSSLIHALAGELRLDIYTLSLSASWISDSALTALFARIPSRCIVLLEDLDAAFTRSAANRGEKSSDLDDEIGPPPPPPRLSSRRSSRYDAMSEVNTLSLSGLLNCLDGVSASEGRLLFATTNHLEKLDPALTRPGRLDVWVAFKNATKWQAEALYRNFFPSIEDYRSTEILLEEELDGIDIPQVPTPSTGFSSIWSTSFASSTSSLGMDTLSFPTAPSSQLHSGPQTSCSKSATTSSPSTPECVSMAYLPSEVEDHLQALQHSAKPLDADTLNRLAKEFANAIPEGEFSIASLQGYLLKNKAHPEVAARDAGAWVTEERETKEKLLRDKEEKELKEKLDREKRHLELLIKRKEQDEKKMRDVEASKLKFAEMPTTFIIEQATKIAPEYLFD